jgi:hypothetical protein
MMSLMVHSQSIRQVVDMSDGFSFGFGSAFKYVVCVNSLIGILAMLLWSAVESNKMI